MDGIEYSTFQSEGRSLSVGVIGNGDPIMLVPGTLQSADRWIDSGYVDALRDEYRVLLFDPLGHGRSERSTEPDDYVSDRLTAHIAAALDHVAEESAHVWGYSRGALMAGEFARKRPQRVRSLIYGGNVLFDAVAVLEAMGLAPDPVATERSEDRAAGGDWAAFWETFPVPIPDETKRLLEHGNDPAVQTAASRGARIAPVVWDLPPVPTLAYWGDEEIFHGLNLEAAEPPITTFTVAGGHGEAFFPSESAIAGVKRFLASTG